jgi:2'-5' RNA ligase
VSETAIVIPVAEADSALQRRYMAAGSEDMPAHITLLYPFTDTELLAVGHVEEVWGALERFAPFDVEFTEIRRFESDPEKVLWLAPRPSEPFVAITESLATAFPEHKPYGGKFDEVIPHLTVAVSSDSRLLGEIEGKVAPELPIEARVAQVAIYEHLGRGWRLRSSFDLSG